MKYDISLRIIYEYEHAVDSSREILRLMPMELPGEQRVIGSTQSIEPKPRETIVRTDYFGNQQIEVAFTTVHREAVYLVKSRVDRTAIEPVHSSSPNLATLRREISIHFGVEPWAPHHFVGASPRVPILEATTAYAQPLAPPDCEVLVAIERIGQALHRDMRYDPKATKVNTPLQEAFEARHGVCQDFAHAMIACLRGVGIPAGYVSGFLRTIPPPGKRRLEGADAMHAWVRAWAGHELGWIEYDPTNGRFAAADHIVVARGRDYSDVAPIKGIMRTHGKHTTEQFVDVVPIASSH